MPKLLFLLTVFISAFGYAQIDILNMTATNSSVNVLYIGIENIIKLKGDSDFSKYQLEIEGAAGKIDKIGAAEYSVMVRVKDTCKIIVTKNGKQLLSKRYKTEFIPSTIVTTGGTMDTIISKNKLLLNPFLSVIFPNCYLAHDIQVTVFHATFIINGDSVITYSVGNKFTEEQIKLIKQLARGDQIYFSNIRATGGPSYCTKSLGCFSIKLK